MVFNTQTFLLVVVSITSFFMGTMVSFHGQLDNCPKPQQPQPQQQPLPITPLEMEAKVKALAQFRINEMKASLPKCVPEHHKATANNGQDEQHPLKLPKTTAKILAGIARTPKGEFMDIIDTGVPPDIPSYEDGDVLLFYQRQQALPRQFTTSIEEPIPSFHAQDALEHCEHLTTIFVDHSRLKNSCIAMMPNYEGFHVQRWLRLPPRNTRGGELDPKHPLRAVGRGMKGNGVDEFLVPLTSDIKGLWKFLQSYFASYEASLERLKPLLQKVATPQKTVVVMISNFGQSELLVNFVCSAKSRHLDLSNVIVFATDHDTKVLAESLGLTSFFDKTIFGDMPETAARQYGDRVFTAIMLAKVICVQMVNALKYNVLFQDVDVVWYKNPIEFFEFQYPDFDMMFQDDGGHTLRYAPYSANSGFYYVRYNAITEHFFSDFLLSGDLIHKWDSHQQALIALLAEHVSLHGLRVKVFSRDTEMFPGGYQYHQKSGKYMRSLFNGDIDPYIFHMSWTHNKDNKLLFFRQMGEWYVQDQCIQKKVEQVVGGDVVFDNNNNNNNNNFVSTCCAAEPLISCHYRDKPSKKPCKDSPPIDKGKPSFW